MESIQMDKLIGDCSIHGNNVESLLNGKCRQCFEEKQEQKKLDETLRWLESIKRNSGVPMRYIGYDLSNYPIDNNTQKNLIENLKKYQFNSNIVMLGSVGVGKTRLGCSLIDKAIVENKTAYYSKYYQLTKIAIEDKKLFKKITEVNFLVIDEFGISDTDYKTQLLFELFDQRYDNKLATMLISNLNVTQLREKIGDALYSRIKQDCISFNCNWQDYRLKEKIN